MKCIKDMSNVVTIDLSYNNFTKLFKTAFLKLKKLQNLNLSYNPLKKISPQLFASATSLTALFVDKFTSYSNVHVVLPALIELSLTISNFNCNAIKAIADVLNTQNVYLLYNSVEIYDLNLQENFVCQTMNQLKNVKIHG